jgi:hypothetical protein
MAGSCGKLEPAQAEEKDKVSDLAYKHAVKRISLVNITFILN